MVSNTEENGSDGSGTGGGEQDVPLKLEVSPSVANLVQGRDTEFICNVQGGRNQPIVTWKRINEQLDPSRHFVMGNKLVIRNVQPNDRGYFECEAQSGSENAREYVRVEVEAREPPKLEIYPQQAELELDYGSGAYAQCRVVAGIPTPTIEWKRADGRALSRNVAIQQDGSLLEIKNAGQEEFGMYECVARNDEGESVGRITIVGRGSPITGDQERPENNPDRQDQTWVIKTYSF